MKEFFSDPYVIGTLALLVGILIGVGIKDRTEFYNIK